MLIRCEKNNFTWFTFDLFSTRASNITTFESRRKWTLEIVSLRMSVDQLREIQLGFGIGHGDESWLSQSSTDFFLFVDDDQHVEIDAFQFVVILRHRTINDRGRLET